MSRRESLQIELLRMRGQIERAEVAAAMVDLRRGTRRIRGIAAVVSSIGLSGARGRDGWMESLLGVMGDAGARSVWTPLARAALRVVRRHPLAAVALAAGTLLALAGWWVGRRNMPAAERERD